MSCFHDTLEHDRESKVPITLTCQTCQHEAHNVDCPKCDSEGPRFWRDPVCKEFLPDWEALQKLLSDHEERIDVVVDWRPR